MSQTLPADLPAPCVLFRQLQDGSFVLFAREGVPFNAKSRYKLYAHGVCELFIRDEESSQYVYEALTAERPYHQRRSTFAALKIMQKKLMTDLDRQIISNFFSLFAGCEPGAIPIKPPLRSSRS